MGNVKPFLFVVIQTRPPERFDVVPAGSDEAERRLVVFGPSAEPACRHHLKRLSQQRLSASHAV